MTAAELMEEWAQQQGWEPERQLEAALTYIDRQKDNQCFENFLAQEAADDKEAEKEAKEANGGEG